MVTEDLLHKYSQSATDYYLFGMGMPGRSFISSNYRFGFKSYKNNVKMAQYNLR
jgi:hypothetical protein